MTPPSAAGPGFSGFQDPAAHGGHRETGRGYAEQALAAALAALAA
ncbi:hypothetical protein ACWY4P_34890 [Streptomyces sp. LZ34]